LGEEAKGAYKLPQRASPSKSLKSPFRPPKNYDLKYNEGRKHEIE
jgi:hypothetical protein